MICVWGVSASLAGCLSYQPFKCAQPLDLVRSWWNLVHPISFILYLVGVAHVARLEPQRVSPYIYMITISFDKTIQYLVI